MVQNVGQWRSLPFKPPVGNSSLTVLPTFLGTRPGPRSWDVAPVRPGIAVAHFPWIGVAGGCCTTSQHKAHNPDVRRVCYRWHPWHGQEVVVVAEITRGGAQLCRCLPADGGASRSQDLPRWMLDQAYCATLTVVERPQISWRALVALQDLLADVKGGSASVVLQDQHSSCPEKGDADACTTPNSVARANQSLRAATNRSHMAKPAPADASDGAAPLDQAAAGPAATPSKPGAARAGGGR